MMMRERLTQRMSTSWFSSGGQTWLTPRPPIFVTESGSVVPGSEPLGLLCFYSLSPWLTGLPSLLSQPFFSWNGTLLHQLPVFPSFLRCPRPPQLCSASTPLSPSLPPSPSFLVLSLCFRVGESSYCLSCFFCSNFKMKNRRKRRQKTKQNMFLVIVDHSKS